jgi:hypothetical protein
MRIRFLRYAQAELREAIQYYESQVPGLGTDFFLEVTAALDHLADFPIAWRKVDAELRHTVLASFHTA